MKQPRTRPFVIVATALALGACGLEPETPATSQRADALDISGGLTGANQAFGRVRPTLTRGELAQVSLRSHEPADFVSREAFCPALAEALCAALEHCGCGQDKGTCYQDVEIDCRGNYGIMGPQTQEAIRQDRVGYDGFAAYRVLRGLALGTGDCQTPLVALEWDRQQMLTFGGIFRGYLAPGSACSLPFAPFRANECLGGVCMLDEYGQGQCAPAVGVGSTCVEGAVCFEMELPVQLRAFYDNTFFGRCDASDPTRPVCVKRAMDFEACAEDDACASGRCFAGQCAPRARDGEACRSDNDCDAGSCQARVCRAPSLPAGQACLRHADCLSDACNGGVCAEPICRR